MRRAILLAVLLLIPARAGAEDHKVNITPDVVYGHKLGLAMTFDVYTPTEKPNGRGILFMVSGGWYSSWQPPEKSLGLFKPLTDHGYTVFAVRHGSSPRFSIPEAVSDVRQSVRYIRANAKKFNIDPNRIGVFGMSAGGHLSLCLGTMGDDGDPQGKDPLDRVSDRVQAVVAFVAPTDLRIAVKDYPDRLPAYKNFPALDLDMKNAEVYSPLAHVTDDDAPTLMLTGAKDDLVPTVNHCAKIKPEFDAKKVPNKLIDFPEGKHGFSATDMKTSYDEMIAWFDKYLLN
ncbi:MAG: alpha/beta hydrolase [Planctomycetales bacterium]